VNLLTNKLAGFVARCYFCRIVNQITINYFKPNLKNIKMAKVKTLTDLRNLKSELQNKIRQMENVENTDSVIQIKVGMATSGIASGAKEVFDYLTEEMAKRNIHGVAIQVGDMGYCYAEPTVEVIIPGKSPIVYGYVDVKKADQIIEKHIKKAELLDGIIPANYQSII